MIGNDILKNGWHTYIVCCSDNTLYTGIAKDLHRRLTEHNSGKGARYTCSRQPVKLVYHEQFPSRSEASRREYQIKKMSRAAKLILIEREEK